MCASVWKPHSMRITPHVFSFTGMPSAHLVRGVRKIRGGMGCLARQCVHPPHHSQCGPSDSGQLPVWWPRFRPTHLPVWLGSEWSPLPSKAKTIDCSDSAQGFCRAGQSWTASPWVTVGPHGSQRILPPRASLRPYP